MNHYKQAIELLHKQLPYEEICWKLAAINPSLFVKLASEYANTLDGAILAKFKAEGKIPAIKECRALQENGLYSLSGGFADTVLDDFDEETVYCTIRYGVADEDGQNISTDTLEIDLADLN